ncbi:alpha/beta hydrolase [Haloarcula sp. 1CSR25-25]|uniref:alpha/beta hydrolase n=1 Tax=Haloarcula sp. 1CSR25-25 TaxID=2862545 RepID=UPI002894D343|nr:alpha/beta hydrolase [Haloarcula sp. 1CSR25-25]MDT3434472.1 alpha/beta hydrolase [Haloarcula sp. 1CSR25-25]
MGDTVGMPGGRRVTASLDRPASDTIVVACPPHPQYGGTRSDSRLKAVSDALAPDIGCLRFDYGPWDEGRGERADAENALAWASERADAVGLFGYSFGAAVALCAAADRDAVTEPAVLSVLAPPARLTEHLDAVAALGAVDCPVQVVVGERDDTVDWEPVADRAADLGHAVERLPADHHFVGQADRVGETVGPFLRDHL